MSYKKNREAERRLEVGYQLQYRGLHAHIERTHRLVRDQQVGIQDQRPCERSALFLSTREFVGIAVVIVDRESNPFEQSLRSVAAAVVVPQSMDRCGFGHRFADRHSRIEARRRILKDHARPSSKPLPCCIPLITDGVAIEDYPTGGRFLEVKQRPCSGGLSASRLPDEAERLPPSKGEIDAVDRTDSSCLAVEQSLGYRIVFFEATDRKQWIVTHRAPPPFCLSFEFRPSSVRVGPERLPVRPSPARSSSVRIAEASRPSSWKTHAAVWDSVSVGRSRG